VRGCQEEALAELGRVAVAGTAECELLALAARSVAETLPAELVTIAEPATGRVRAVHGAGGHAARSRLRVPIGAGLHPMAELRAVSPRPDAFGEEARDFASRVAQLLEDAMRQARGERALRESLANLGSAEASHRALVARVVQLAEEERGRIAADMHDDVLQAMAASALRLQLIREGAAVRDGPALDRLAAGLDRSMERLRDLVFELRTDALDEGLGRALERHLAHEAVPTALVHRVVDRLVREPAPGPRLTLYRIAQEALLNVRKHSCARTVEVTLEADGDGVRMRVADDGRGFDPDAADGRAAGHIGLVAMRERASLAGGSVTVDSAPGRGTVVDVRVPSGPAPAP
jgi:signal transduction histidine kinase